MARQRVVNIVDRKGLPIGVSTHAANHHEVIHMQPRFDLYMIEVKSENLIGDRKYIRDRLDNESRHIDGTG